MRCGRHRAPPLVRIDVTDAGALTSFVARRFVLINVVGPWSAAESDARDDANRSNLVP